MSSELGLIWQDLKGSIYDPLLTPKENRQLQSQTVAEVLRLSQQLYLSYLYLLDTLRRRAVFSDQANRCRLAAQMAFDCTNCLNVHSIRRNVASGIKATRSKEQTGERCNDPETLKAEQQEEQRPMPKVDICLHQTRPRSLKSGVSRHSRDIEKDIKDMTEKMGDLDLELAYDLMPCHLEDRIFEPMLTKTRFNPKKKNLEKFVNPKLKRPNAPGVSHRKQLDIPADHKKPRDQSSRAYTAWLQWWKSSLSLEDYFCYISNQDSDYLGAVFHLYNSSDNDDEEDEKQKALHLRLEERKRCQRAKIEALKRKKQEYVTGLWNVNTVLLGGLWKEPALEEEEDNPDEEITPSSELAKKPAVWTGKEGEGPLDVDQVQRSKLERIWNVLCLPDPNRLDMAIKYSSHAYRNQLEEAIAAWECAARLIQQREMLLARFELFERDASDPNRFFQHGYNGTSLARMVEARKRIELQSHISTLEKKLSEILSQITHSFHDTVTYKGRPYSQKMRCDRVEMLYWLQQERRVKSLETVVVEKKESLPIRLPSLVANLREYPGSGTHPTPRGYSPAVSQSSVHLPQLTNTNELCVSSLCLPKPVETYF
ncbi:uncharacterized protein FYW47_018381 [Aplochiton taeniatus]